MKEPLMQPFDVRTVPLAGSNLIEASAGTGKTYSIAILVLRLLLEQHTSLREILMVTYTRAAAAELETRVRKFVRVAQQEAEGRPSGDPLIQQIVAEAASLSGLDSVQQHLKAAVLQLDETSVTTIHSFCQQSLLEFAFETGQGFGAEVTSEEALLRLEQIQWFWRTYVTTIPEPILTPLMDYGFSMDLLHDTVSSHLDGRHYLLFDHSKRYACEQIDYAAIETSIVGLQAAIDQAERTLMDLIDQNLEHYRAEMAANAHGRKVSYEKLKSASAVRSFYREKKRTLYVEKIFAAPIAQEAVCAAAKAALRESIQRLITDLHCAAIDYVKTRLTQYKARRNLLAFSDMIDHLHRALLRPGSERLVAALRRRYKAVFVDEFQDTDREQYEIFQTAFGRETTLFYIGDPKQSIYAFRKADVFTYIEARDRVDHVYSMNVNYRSSTSYIEAMNAFFSIDDPFDFKDHGDAIQYIPVESPELNSKGMLYAFGEHDAPISFIRLPNKKGCTHAAVAQVLHLLAAGAYSIVKDGIARAVVPADIGIVVHKNNDARDIAAALSLHGVPAVAVSDGKVLQTEEALHVWHVLEAMRNPNAGNIRRALFSPLTGIKLSEIQNLDIDTCIEQFQALQSAWNEAGIYKALTDWMHRFQVQPYLLHPNTPGGERMLTNANHIIELLHQNQATRNLSALELSGWLKRAIDGLDIGDDEHLLRLERDDAAVKVVTIHRSKGLEYNIVVATSLDLVFYNNQSIWSLRDDMTQRYISGSKHELNEQQQSLAKLQAEQEHRRLVYVAITRAVYKSFVLVVEGKYKENSALKPFFNGALSNKAPVFAFQDPLAQDVLFEREQEESAINLPHPKVARHFSLRESNWIKTSYSSLAAWDNHGGFSLGGAQENEYDDFVFKKLPRGPQTGIWLHEFLEGLNFQVGATQQAFYIERLIEKAPWLKPEIATAMLAQMTMELMHAPIAFAETAFYLRDIHNEQRSCELTFDFLVPEFSPAALADLSNNELDIRVRNMGNIQGVITGTVDLFFQTGGKYYILDWKSNYLGSSLVDYSFERLKAVMNAQNYHLQYLLYTLAASKYLTCRLGQRFDFERDFGGVIYVFLRGVRKGADTGIYTQQPTRSQIDALKKALNIAATELL